MRYYAKPELKDRLIQLNGSQNGYLHKFRAAMARNHREAELPSMSFMWQAMNPEKSKKSMPAWQVVEAIRYAERQPDMPYMEAFAIADRWFQVELPESQKKGVKKNG